MGVPQTAEARNYRLWKTEIWCGVATMAFGVFFAAVLVVFVFVERRPSREWFQNMALAQFCLVALPFAIGVLCLSGRPCNPQGPVEYQGEGLRKLSRFFYPLLILAASLITLLVIWRENLNVAAIILLNLAYFVILGLGLAFTKYSSLLADALGRKNGFANIAMLMMAAAIATNVLYWGSSAVGRIGNMDGLTDFGAGMILVSLASGVLSLPFLWLAALHTQKSVGMLASVETEEQ